MHYLNTLSNDLLDFRCHLWILIIKMDEFNMNRTSFVTITGLYKYSRTVFVLKNVPATVQKAMRVILAIVKRQHALAYIGDIITFTPTLEDHIKYVESVFHLIHKVDLILKLKRCFFLSNFIDYFGHACTPDRLLVAINTKETPRTLNFPANATKIRSLLVICNFYRSFVPNFARKAVPMNKLLN